MDGNRQPTSLIIPLLLLLALVVSPWSANALDLDIDRRIIIGSDDDSWETIEIDPLPEEDEDWDCYDDDEFEHGRVDLDGMADFQRVDGLTLGFVQRMRGAGPHGPKLTLREARALSRGRWLFDAEFEQPLIPETVSFGAGFFRRTAPFDGLDVERISDVENLLAALLVKEDYRDYYEDQGVELYARYRPTDNTSVRAALVRSKQRALVNGTRTSLTRWGEDFRGNPRADDGNLRAFHLEFEQDTRPTTNTPASGHWYRARWERAGDDLGGDFDYSRLLFDLRSFVRTSPGQQLRTRVIYGATTTGILPEQKRFAIGGVGTLRAHTFKELAGDEVLLGNLEYRFDFDSDIFGLVFADVGATAEVDESLRDREFALDGGFGIGLHGERGTLRRARPAQGGRRAHPELPALVHVLSETTGRPGSDPSRVDDMGGRVINTRCPDETASNERRLRRDALGRAVLVLVLAVAFTALATLAARPASPATDQPAGGVLRAPATADAAPGSGSDEDQQPAPDDEKKAPGGDQPTQVDEQDVPSDEQDTSSDEQISPSDNRTTPESDPSPEDADADAEHDLTVGRVRIGHQGDDLVTDITLDHLLDLKAEELVGHAVPATVMIDVDLWRERGIWFDRLEASRHLLFRLQYDVWDEVYELMSIRDGERSMEFLTSIDEAHTIISEQRDVHVGALDDLDEEHRYYLVITAALKPLTLEDVTELEGWLSGELKSPRNRGFGILGLPRQLFGVLLNLTGLRDRNTTQRTRSFRRSEALEGTVLEHR